MNQIKSLFENLLELFIKHMVISNMCYALTLLILTSYLFPQFGENLNNSTKWLSNITPLVILIIGYFFKEEITNWHYKKRSEAASEIIGKFRVCAKDVIYWVHGRILTPRQGERSAERKIHLSINKYIENSLKPSAQFPIHIRKILDEHFGKMKILANTISGSITINTSQQPMKQYGKVVLCNANEDLRKINDTMDAIQDFLDLTFSSYLDK